MKKSSQAEGPAAATVGKVAVAAACAGSSPSRRRTASSLPSYFVKARLKFSLYAFDTAKSTGLEA